MIEKNVIQEQVGRFCIFRQTAEGVKENGVRMGLLSQLRADFPGNDWAIVPANEAPKEWAEMRIEGGELI